jgi:nuclear pore complex protein Nup93
MNMLWQLAEWISTNGAVSPETALAASEECDKMLRMGDRPGRPAYDRKKLLLYATICGCCRQIEKLLKDLPTLFNTIEDFLWFMLSALREYSTATSSNVLNDGLVPYTLDDLQSYLNKFEPSYKEWKRSFDLSLCSFLKHPIAPRHSLFV